MSLYILIRKPLIWAYIVGVVVLLSAAGLWWQKVDTDPQRVFWRTLSQSLSTSGVTVTARQLSGATIANQVSQYSFGLDRSNTLTTLTQGTTKVVDETYGTPVADYTRYTNVQTNQKSASGKPLDFSTVLGVWAKSDHTAASANTNVLLSQAMLGTGLPLGGVAFPIANLTPSQRAQLIAQIREQGVYQVSFGAVTKTQQNGRLIYTYHVTVQPILYASMMKSFAKQVGLHDFDQLDPNAFAGQQDLKLELSIDARAHHLVAASAANGQVKQTYSGYDLPVAMPTPQHTITASQLQQRLTQLQK